MSNQRKQQPEKISADCPHCGFSQLESAYAKSTICRRCSQPFSIEKLLAKEVSSLKPPSIFDKFSKLISRETIREISCFSCHAVQQVSSAAESSLCPKCGSYIDLRDFKITGPFGRSIQTQGEVVITSKGDATSQRILCGRAQIEGKMRGHMLCTDTVSLKTQGKLLGIIEADTVVIEKKCDAELARPVKARVMEINGKVSGNFFVETKVTINKHGSLTGTIHARSIVIEKGGIFSGELHIGEGLNEDIIGAADNAVQEEMRATVEPGDAGVIESSLEPAPEIPPEEVKPAATKPGLQRPLPPKAAPLTRRVIRK